MPSDLFNTTDNKNNNYGLLADSFSKSIYNNYDLISNKINRIMEVAFGIVHDLYNKYESLSDKDKQAILDNRSYDKDLRLVAKHSIDRIALTKDAKEKLDNHNKINPTSESINSSEFSEFVTNLLIYHPASDIGRIIDKPKNEDESSDFLTSISLLRHELLEKSPDSSDENLDFDICATPNEFPFSKNCEFHTSCYPSFAFKIVPTLKNVYKLTTDSMQENTIPEMKYCIKIDINRLIYSIICIFDPSSITPEMGKDDREKYIRNGVIKFKNCPEIFTRKIILELYDNYFNVYGNWEQFIKRFKDYADIIYEDPLVRNIVTKINHYNLFTPNLQTNIFDTWSYVFENGIEHVHFEQYNDFINSMYLASQNVVDEAEKDIFLSLFAKTFSVFFTTGVSYLIYSKMDNNIQVISLTNYYKEFFAKYNTSELLSRSTVISDYNIRDFFQTIIKETNCPCGKQYLEKMSNGENAYFMFCKKRRSIWIETTVTIMATIKMLKAINTVYANHDAKKEKFFHRNTFMLMKTFRQCIELLFKLTNYEMSEWYDNNSYDELWDSKIGYNIKYILNLKASIDHRYRSFCSIKNISEYDLLSLGYNFNGYQQFIKIYENFKRYGFMYLDQGIMDNPKFPFE